MIYFTGDTHKDIDIHKLSSKRFAPSCTKEDYVIILGDFGCVWSGGNSDDYWLNWYEEKPYTTLFVPGNHENYHLLRKYPAEEWHGGVIRRIRPSVIMLERGYVFDIDGKSFFCMGGADSHDKQWRRENVSWWPEEMPCDDEYATANMSLNAHDWKVDYVLTHCAKAETHVRLTGDIDGNNKLTRFLQVVDEQLDYRFWLFGHYHMDLMPDERELCMYNHIVSLDMVENYIAAQDALEQGIPPLT